MPIEIRELSVKVNIKEENQGPSLPEQTINTSRARTKILDECMEQVAQMFRNKKER